jgi:hypothetical protein
METGSNFIRSSTHSQRVSVRTRVPSISTHKAASRAECIVAITIQTGFEPESNKEIKNSGPERQLLEVDEFRVGLLSRYFSRPSNRPAAVCE